MEVVQQRFDRTDIQRTQSSPIFRQHSGQNWHDGSLGLPAGRGCNDEQVFATKNNGDHFLLEGSKLGPPKAVDNVMLNAWME
jgi:hypothetical protein